MKNSKTKKGKIFINGEEIDGILCNDEFKFVNYDIINKLAVVQNVPKTQQCITLCFNGTNKAITLPFTCSYKTFKETLPTQWMEKIEEVLIFHHLLAENIKEIHIDGFEDKKKNEIGIKITIDICHIETLHRIELKIKFE